ncbi:MAG TPA: NifB/NifX family molybdenum-iron cluster-binding protein [Anaerolineae bacterium]|nr:NifB/NifX family molybdenum-iron cluster-binding protein [Anaerolineae bacterium]
MKIVVTSAGGDLDAPASILFGRCPFYVFVDTDTWQFEALDNPAMSAAGGAGIQAAQYIVAQGAQAVLSGHMGPNAVQVLQAAKVPVYLTSGTTVRQAVEAFKAGRLPTADQATVQAHAGMGGGMVTGGSKSMLPGRGTGGARGTGGGMGMMPRDVMPAQPAPAAVTSRQKEVASLQQIAGELRKQLASVAERIDKLEKGE